MKVDSFSELEKAKVAAALVLAGGGPEPMLVCGGVASTVQPYVALGPVLPSDVARTANVCAPSARPLYCFGLAHAAKPAPSSWHSYVLPGLFAEKLKLAVCWFVSCGGPLIVTRGLSVSIVQLNWPVGLVLPAASVA